MFKDFIIKYRAFILLSIGSLLLVLSLGLLIYDKVSLAKEEVFAEVALEKSNEEEYDEPDDIGNSSGENVSVNTEYLDNEDIGHENDSNNQNQIPNSEYIGFLEINNIGLKVGFLPKKSRYNNVNRNIQVLTVSDYPDVMNGNFILAGHSGSSKISYFKNLYKLKLGDKATVYYKNYVYYYKIVDIYYVPKVGSLEIKRNYDKSVMTLITCTRNSNTEQTVYILELYSKTRKEG